MTPTEPLQTWRELSVPSVDTDAWDSSLAIAGLREIERLKRSLDAAQALLLPLVQAEAGRDTKALLQRELKISSGDSHRAMQLAVSVQRVEGAANALAAGLVGADHLRALRNIKDVSTAAALLEIAVKEQLAPEEFVRDVTQE